MTEKQESVFRKLIERGPADSKEHGAWLILGEPEHPDFSTAFVYPPLGTFVGFYEDAALFAVTSLPDFLKWEFGGKIERSKVYISNGDGKGGVALTVPHK